MKLLILGGTLFLGRHVVEAALGRGHEVTLFNRGRTNPELFPQVERLVGDRDGDLGALEGRRWDAVIDTSGYVPRVVRASADLLAESVERYLFVSTISVYSDTRRHGLDESAPLLRLDDPGNEDVGANYGALKVACEDVVREAFPAGHLIVRAGLIVGPHDPTNRFTYWVTRVTQGGRVLAPRPADQPVQFIDARDLSAWIVAALETSVSGTYNATGPRDPLTMRDTLEGIRDAVASGAELVWVDEGFLLEHSVEPWSDLPLWLAPNANVEDSGFLALDVRRAIDSGLTFRPLSETARDSLAWAGGSSRSGGVTPSGQGGAGLDRQREADLLEAWDALGRFATG